MKWERTSLDRMRRRSWIGVIVVLVACSLGMAESRPGVRLRSRTLEAPASRAEALRALLALPAGPTRHILLQLDGPPSAAERRALEAAGVRLVQYVPDNGWFAAVAKPPSADLPALSRLRAAWAIEPSDRLAPELAGVVAPSAANQPAEKLSLSILVFGDVVLDEIAGAVVALGGEVRSLHPAFDLVFATLPRDSLASLAAVDGVHWIAPMAPPPVPEMGRARAFLRAEELGAPPYGLSGTGVSVSVHDFGHAFQHTDFAARWIQGDAAQGQTLSSAVHPSMTAGTIGGDGTLNGLYRGVAPACDLYTYSYESEPCCEENNYADVADALARNLDIANDSWGYSGCSPLPYGDYTVNAQVFDRQVRGLDSDGSPIGSPTVVVFSAGNERDGFGDADHLGCVADFDPPFLNYGTLNQPKPAKNILVVGAVDSANELMTTFSSWGPTSDGRLRPDLVAAGAHGGTIRSLTSAITNCYGQPEGHPNQQCYRAPGASNTDYGGYAWFSQTSSAAALASGSSALFLEDFRARFATDPLPATVKAHFVHTARDLDDATSWYNPGPDYASGYGVLDVRTAIDQLRSGRSVERCLDETGSATSLSIPLAAADSSVKVTIAWDDPPATPAGAGPALINDLDLTVVDSSATTHYPWSLDPASPSAPAARAGPNRRDNVEQVVVHRPPGTAESWTATVSAAALQQGPQCFALVYSGCSGEDRDGDGRRTADTCGSPGLDCNDADPSIHAGAAEVCNGFDDDCDGEIDEGCDRICDDPARGGLLTGLATDLIDSSVDVDLVWNARDGVYAGLWAEGRDVYIREREPGGSDGPIFQISYSEAFAAGRPHIAWSGESYGIVWSDMATPSGTYFRAWSSPSNASPVHMLAVGASPPRIDVAWNGSEFGVVWNLGSSLVFQAFDRDGTPRGDRTYVDYVQEILVSELDLEWTGTEYAIATGGCVVGSSCHEHALHLTTLGATGRAQFSSPIDLPGSSPRGPRIVWNGLGYGLSWADDRAGAWQIYFARLGPTGTLLGPEVLLSSTAAIGSQPAVAWSGEEHAVAYATTGTVRVSRLDSAGVPLGSLELYTEVGQPAIVWNGRTFGAAWASGNPMSVWLTWLACCDDVDADGFNECWPDCDDNDPEIYPGASQACDGLNNDCSDPSWPALPAAEADYDHDGVMSCAGDCDDHDVYTRPGLPEICDLADNDCDGLADDGFDGDLDGLADCIDACPDTHDPAQVPAAIVAEAGAGRLARILLATGNPTVVAASLTPRRIAVNRAGTAALLTQDQAGGSLARVVLSDGGTSTVATSLGDVQGPAWNLAESSAYVARAASGDLLVVDLSTGIHAPIASGLGQATGVALSADGARVYVTDRLGGRLLRKDLGSGAVDVVASDLDEPLGLAVDPLETTAWIAERGSGAVVSVSLASGATTTVATGLSRATDVALGPAGTTLFVLVGSSFPGSSDGALRLLDLATGRHVPVARLLDSPTGFDLVHRDCLAIPCTDGDGDGYGFPGVVDCPAGPLPDCADSDPERHPGAPETCNGLDDDCDDAVDEGCDTACDGPEEQGDESLLAPGAVSAADAHLAWNGTGYGLVWSDQRDGNAEIYFARLDAGMARVGGEVRVTTAPGASEAPSIVWTGTEYGVAFADDRDGNTRVFFVRLDPDGVKLGTDHAVAATESATSRVPRLAWTGHEYGLLWNDNREGTWETYFRTISADGLTLGTPRSVSTTPYNSNPCRVVWTGTEYAVTYNDIRSGDWEIYVVRLDANGFRLGAEQRVTYSAGVSRSPSILWLGQDYGMFWVDNRFGQDEIFWARLGPDGVKIGADVRLMPAVGILPLFAAAWTGSEYGLVWVDDKDGNAELYFERIDANGTPVGPEIRITSNPSTTLAPDLEWTGAGFGTVFVDGRLGLGGAVYGSRVSCCDDLDGDGATECHDCDDLDARRHPGAVEACDGIDNDCDLAVPLSETTDADGDAFVACADCDDASASTYPGASESNDGIDNQCPGEAGFGTIDEVSGWLGFHDPTDRDELSWDAQPGATRYQVARADDPAFSVGCVTFATSDTSWTDTAAVPSGLARHYLLRAVGPYVGSWGRDSLGVERQVSCAGESACDNGIDDDRDRAIDCEDPDCSFVARCVPASFGFYDRVVDDIPPTALREFLANLAPSADDYLYFSIAGGSPTDGAWCARRADWYVATYLDPPATGSPVMSGAWNKWFRTQAGPWSAPTTQGFANVYGVQDDTGSYSWESESGLGGLRLTIIPGDTGRCEAADSNESCGPSTPPRNATLTLRVGIGRLTTCGF